MNRPAEPTPYTSHSRRTNRRRTVLIVIVAIAAVAVGLALHVTGVLPPG
jgi:hypothetical protein